MLVPLLNVSSLVFVSMLVLIATCRSTYHPRSDEGEDKEAGRTQGEEKGEGRKEEGTSLLIVDRLLV